jgi:RNA polymerase sigma-54 factor
MLSQRQTQKQQLKILPQQIQLLNLYFLNSLELEQRIKNELEENPFLDMNSAEVELPENKLSKDSVQDFQDWEEFKYNDAPDYKAEYQNYFNGEHMPEMAITSISHFKDDAKQQLRLLDIPEADMALAAYLIDMLNNQGLMDKDLSEVADDLSFNLGMLVDEKKLESALLIVQDLEPIGIGSRSVQECLLCQLERMDHRRPDVFCALKLVRDHFNDLMHRQFEKIQHSLNIDEEELRIVLNKIGSLKFHPVSESTVSFEPKDTIIPDFIITRHGDGLPDPYL